MKTNNLFLIFLLAAIFLVGCSSDDTADVFINADGSGTTGTDPIEDDGESTPADPIDEDTELNGTLSEDLTLETDRTYTLTGALIVPEGITLTINPGVVVRARIGADVFIAVLQGGVINAVGTASDPIIFTSDSATPNAGDWGGLIILGRAPINSVSGGDATSTSEIGGLPYGGSVVNDNSGILRYVRVEYSGGAADASSENNGFSFYGVGNGTTIEFIQAFEGRDDGIEFFGGTVNATYLSVVGAQDDSVDWTEGFTGTLTNVYIEHRQSHDKGIEADGFNTDTGNNSDPIFFSSPTINNLTVNGNGSSNDNEAIRLRAGTRAIFNNVLISGFAEAFDLDGDNLDSPTGVGVLEGNTRVNDITFDDVLLFLQNDTGELFGEAEFFMGIDNGIGADYDSWNAGWTRS